MSIKCLAIGVWRTWEGSGAEKRMSAGHRWESEPIRIHNMVPQAEREEERPWKGAWRQGLKLIKFIWELISLGHIPYK